MLSYLPACDSGTSSALKLAYSIAGENAYELRKVMEHYRQTDPDEQKREAAAFLIENMPGKYADQNHTAEEFTPMLREWNELLAAGVHNKQVVFDSLATANGLRYKSEIYHDLKTITADYLINTIDRAFEVWPLPWNETLSFEQFCEEILPYRVDNEPLEYWRDKILDEYRPLLDSMKAIPNLSAVEACTIVNSRLIREWEGEFAPTSIPTMNYTMLKEAWTGTCKERTALGIFIMRAMGIPVTRDYTPQWPHRRMGHWWNTVHDGKGNYIVFMATESNPGQPHEEGQKMGKVYRHRFTNQPELLAIHAQGGRIPAAFGQPTFTDVTADYLPVASVKVPIEVKTNKAIPYLAVFDNQSWTPIAYGTPKSKIIHFENIGRNIVYLCVAYPDNNYTPLQYPFRITEDGDSHYYVPDQSHLRPVRLLRKYPLLMNPRYLRRMKGGYFEASSDASFRPAKRIHTIEHHPELYYQTVETQLTTPYRYIRYVSPDSSYCNIAELEFYGEDRQLLTGKIIGTPGSYLNDPSYSMEKAFDKNPLTFVDAAHMTGGWVGLDLVEPAVVSQIRYLPRNDDNMINAGQMYELFYWELHGWKSLGRRIPEEQVLYYDNVPANALLLLKNHTKGKEERIFTYENDQQVWW